MDSEVGDRFVCGDSKRKAESKGDIEQEGPKAGYEAKSCKESVREVKQK